MAIARFPSIVIDCPDPGALATFYGAMLDWKVEIRSDWADVRADYGQCLSFQQVEGYTPPRWPADRRLVQAEAEGVPGRVEEHPEGLTGLVLVPGRA